MNHIDYMTRAIRLASKGRGTTSPNPMVGCVIVKNGKVIAEGYHARCGGDHAEVIALKKAGEKARGATLYVTLEPCAHYGRTPPCVKRIIDCGIKKVIVGMKDPNPLMNGKSVAILRKFGIAVEVGVLEHELRQLNEVFLKYIIQRMPFVVAKTAQTLDGKIATARGQSKWITSQASRDFAHELRNNFDAILVGINTVLNDNPFLNAAKQSKRIKKIVLDSYLKTPLNANIFKKTESEDIIIVTTANASDKRIRALSSKARVITTPKKGSRIDLKWLFKELAKQEISSILIEGGATVVGNALKNGLVDKMFVFIAPKILGDASARNSVIGFKASHVDDAVRLKDLSVGATGGDLFIQGYVYRDR